MERTPIKTVNRMLDSLAKRLGRPLEMFDKTSGPPYRMNPGHLYIDHLPGSGYRVEEIINPQGGVTTPFGEHRLTTRELYYQLYTVQQVVLYGSLGILPFQVDTETTKNA